MSFYRLQDADRDVAELLDPARQWSEAWGGGGLTVECRDEDGDVCRDTSCERCRGAGDFDDSVRHGVSVCATTDSLADYFRGRDAADPDFLATLVLVEVDGPLSEDADHDADEGALLILPTRIVAVGPVPADMVNAICA